MDSELENDYTSFHEKLKGSDPREAPSLYDREIERLELKLREFRLGYEQAQLDGSGQEAAAELYIDQCVFLIDKLRYERGPLESETPTQPPSNPAALSSNVDSTYAKPVFSSPKSSNPKRLTVKQAAEYLGIKKQTLYQWCSEKRIPHMKIGSRTFFDAERLDAWIAKRNVKPIADRVKTSLSNASVKDAGKVERERKRTNKE